SRTLPPTLGSRISIPDSTFQIPDILLQVIASAIGNPDCGTWDTLAGSSWRSDGLLARGSLLEPVEILIQARAELFGEGWSRVAGGLGDATALAGLLVVEAAAQECQGGVHRGAGPAAAGGRAGAATTGLGIDPPGAQEQLDGLGLGTDGRAAGLRPRQDPGGLSHHFGHPAEQGDLVTELIVAVGQIADLLRHFFRTAFDT